MKLYIRNILIFFGILLMSACSNQADFVEKKDEVPPVAPPNNENNNSEGGSSSTTVETFKIENGRVKIEGKIDTSMNDRFGYRVLMIDMNHDGKTDILVSGHLNRRYGGDEGLVYVYLRNSDNSFNDVYSYVISAPVTGGALMFGASFINIDWNDDGIEDLLIGAPGDDVCSGANRGAVYVYYGDNTGIKTGNYDTRFCDSNANTRYFGMSLAKYDIDQDTKEDLVIGAPYSRDAHNDWAGRAFVFLNGATTASYYFESDLNVTNNAYFAQSLAFADINHDGFKDLLVSMPFYGTGYVYVYLHDGVNTFANPHDEDLYIRSSRAYADDFGLGLAAFDIDADGYEEIFIGHPGLDAFGTNAGGVEVFKDINQETTTVAYSIIKHPEIDNENVDNSYFGYGLSAIDYNADSKIKLATQVLRKGTVSTTDYHSSLFLLSIDSTARTESSINFDNNAYMVQSSSYFGSSSAIADIDGDGVKDLIVGAYHAYTYPISGTYSGVVFVYKGVKDDTFVSKPSYLLSPDIQGNNSYAYSLLVMDINNDGESDLLVAVPGDDSYGTDRGTVYVYFGGKDFDTRADAFILDPQYIGGGTYSNFFGSGMTKGDLNNDGHDDLIISAYYDDVEALNRGAVYIWRSNASGQIAYTSDPSQTIYPANISAVNTTSDLFGKGLAVLDVNPTGTAANDRNDLLIGVPGDDTDGTDSGRVYVVYGDDASGDGDNDFPTTTVGVIKDTIDHASNYFGYSLAVGNYNGDTYSDLAIGAMYEDFLQTNSGTVFIYSIDTGYDITTANADILLHSNFNNPLANNYWGSSLEFYDINADGKDDLFIGAMGYSGTVTAAGSVDIETDITQYE